MSHEFKVGDRVRIKVALPGGAPVGTEGTVDHVGYYIEVSFPGHDELYYRPDEIELVAPEKQPTEQLSGNFSLHGFGLQELFLFIDAFQAVGEDKFKIEWTLSGTAGESGSL